MAKIGCVLGAGAVVLVGALVIVAIRAIRQINEPDPSKYGSAQLASDLRGFGLECRVDKVLYVNQDSMDYIFEGDCRSSTLDPRGRPGEFRFREIGGGRTLYLVGSYPQPARIEKFNEFLRSR